MSKWYKNKAETLIEEHGGNHAVEWWNEDGAKGWTDASSSFAKLLFNTQDMIEISEPEALCTIRDWGHDVGDRLDVKPKADDIIPPPTWLEEKLALVQERTASLEELIDDVIERNAQLSDAYQLLVWLIEERDFDDVGDDVYDAVYDRWVELDKQVRPC